MHGYAIRRFVDCGQKARDFHVWPLAENVQSPGTIFAEFLDSRTRHDISWRLLELG